MEERIIFHSDLNAFYASVETVLQPAYRGKALAVCGAKEERHGIVLAKTEAAKRMGVKTGMCNDEARCRCPGLIIVPPHFEAYQRFSGAVREIYRRYTNRIEMFGIDECWLDMTQNTRCRRGEDAAVANEIRKAVKRETGLSVSIGVSFNKVFAKLGSDMKKPDAVTVLHREDVASKIWPLPIEALLFVGPATAAQLHDIGVDTIGALASLPPALPGQLLGVNGMTLWHMARGEDRSAVAMDDAITDPKSVGNGMTCKEDLTDTNAVWCVILMLAQEVGRRLRLAKQYAKKVELTVKRSNFSCEQFQTSLSYPTISSRILARAAFALFEKRYDWSMPVRAVTVTATDLCAERQSLQMNLWNDLEHTAMREERLDQTIDTLCTRFGKGSLSYGALLYQQEIPEASFHAMMPGGGVKV